MCTTPNHVAKGAIDKEAPKQAEPEPGFEVDALHQGAGNQRGGDDREHSLEQGKGGGADVEAISQGGIAKLAAHTVHPHLAEAADEGAIEAEVEGKAVADHDPKHSDEPHQEEAHHHGVEHVLGPGEAAVEERQARGHQKHEGRAHQHQQGVGPIGFGLGQGSMGCAGHQGQETSASSEQHERIAPHLGLLNTSQYALAYQIKGGERCFTTAGHGDMGHEGGRPLRRSPRQIVRLATNRLYQK